MTKGEIWNLWIDFEYFDCIFQNWLQGGKFKPHIIEWKILQLCRTYGWFCFVFFKFIMWNVHKFRYAAINHAHFIITKLCNERSYLNFMSVHEYFQTHPFSDILKFPLINLDQQSPYMIQTKLWDPWPTVSEKFTEVFQFKIYVNRKFFHLCFLVMEASTMTSLMLVVCNTVEDNLGVCATILETMFTVTFL